MALMINKKRIAPFGLYLALIALLVSIGLYIVQRELTLYLQVSLGLILLGLALFTILDPRKVKQVFSGRQARYGSNALLISIAFIGILVVLNYWVYQGTQRWDLTEDQENTLATESIETLESLPEPVTAVAFFSPDRSTEQARSLLETYKFFGAGKFDYEFVDPLSNPVAAQEADVNRDGTIVLRMGERQEQVTISSELQMTGALVRLISEEQQIVYFLTGHGEYNPEDTGDQGYDRTRRTLEGKNYSVEVLNLLSSNQIPEDAAAIIIAGPIQPLTENEVALLDSYLSGGGALFVMEEPPPFTEFGNSPDPLAQYLSDEWGLALGENVVVDLTSSQPYVTYADQYGNHPITEKMQRLSAAFPTARSVTTSDEVEEVESEEIVFTAPQSWAETDFESLSAGGEVSPQEGEDMIGPVPIGAVAERTGSEARIAVFGDADFATDANSRVLGNGDLFVNTLDWAVGQEELINLTPKNRTQRILLPPQPLVMNLILLGAVFIMPGLVLVAGVVVWVRRRRRG
jgi:ABC-type uncharacterized transport system involved in gliding motility auxiliary subunit